MTTVRPPFAYTTTLQSPAVAQPAMQDVFASFDPGAGLVGQVHGRIAMPDTPLVPVVVSDAPVEQQVAAPAPRARTYEEPLAWLLLKHAVQLALAASVVLFVVRGGSAPGMALSYVATGLLLMGTMVIADRMRFADCDPDAFELLGVVGPEVVVTSAAATREVQVAVAPPVAPLVPLVEQMQVVMPARVDVT